MKPIKTCPFCGRKPKWGEARRNFHDDNITHYCLYCNNNNCGVVETGWYATKDLAIAAWNTRYKGRVHQAAVKEQARRGAGGKTP